MVRDAFLVCDLIRIDCQGLEKSDYKKIGVKLRVSFILLVMSRIYVILRCDLEKDLFVWF